MRVEVQPGTHIDFMWLFKFGKDAVPLIPGDRLHLEVVGSEAR